MRSDAPGPPPVSVYPRTPTYDSRPIIAYDGHHVFVERTGELAPAARLAYLLVLEPPSILVCDRASALLAELNDSAAARIPGWQYRVSPVVRRTYRQHRRDKPTETHDIIVAFLGWKTSTRHSHYHYPLDPSVFTGHYLRKVVTAEEEPDKLRALVVWATDVRQWCRDNGLKINGGTGALAVQLLKDPRFYPQPRRKIPQATNERARAHLPGNHYELFVKERTYHDAYYIDMQSAHHVCASEITFPCPNGLLARGPFHNPPEDIAGREPWVRSSRPAFTSLLKSHGLLLIRLEVPRRATLAGMFAPPYMKKPGLRLAWVYTNELPMIRELGGIVEGIEAAWTSYTADRGLNIYARWGMNEAASMSPQRKRWGKPTLLAVYGMLAARPTEREFGFRHAKGGMKHTYMTPGGPLPAVVRKQSKATESPVVNVIHRGMIEAEVRLRALAFARKLHAQGCQVLCIYADSVIISSKGPVPLIEQPWQIKVPLTRLEFFNPTSFHSVEMTRLPGIPREGRDRIARLEQIRIMGEIMQERKNLARKG